MKNQEKKPKNPSVYPSWDMTFNENPNTNLFSAGTSKGMSLRDYFANSAMQGMLSCRIFSPSDVEVYAEQAYKLADAMLKQREL